MKLIEEMTGVEKSANLMVALGVDVASKVMKNLSDDNLDRISEEIAKVDSLTADDREDIIGEFLIEYRKRRGDIIGGDDVATDLLNAAFGEEKTNDILNRLTRRDLERGFDYLKNIDSEILASLLEKEHPQTITVTLSHLPSNKSAGILKNISPYIGKEVLKRMARLERTSPDIVLEIVRTIRKKYETFREERSDHEVGGLNTLVDIMSQMSADDEERLMDYFDRANPSIAKEIRERIFTFDNVLSLTHKEIQILIDEINDDYLLVKALKGAIDEIRFIFLRNMSLNRATDILIEMDRIGPIRLNEVHNARNRIVSIMRALNNDGVITIRKDREELVE